ncbi:hypothetical protein ACF1AJ_19810 [Leifsonia sp. NPDC014704]|uniref:hypothetical protein n=1 Tax=Leifsonia sp. NPDC014704 TaxID=3364123 RepID=UPI0011C4596E
MINASFAPRLRAIVLIVTAFCALVFGHNLDLQHQPTLSYSPALAAASSSVAVAASDEGTGSHTIACDALCVGGASAVVGLLASVGAQASTRVHSLVRLNLLPSVQRAILRRREPFSAPELGIARI